MPHFYLNVVDGTGRSADAQGQDFPDAASARLAAVQGARSLMAEELLAGELNLTSFIQVEDQAHQLLFVVSFADAITINHG